MLLFCSEEHAADWCNARRILPGGILTPDQCWRLAYRWYKDRLREDWRRFTLEETEAIFAEIGLTGPFWSLRDGG